MGKLSRCPGCRQEFLNGRSYSVHLTCCKSLRSATDSALKKHKINSAKKTQAKKLDIAVRKDLATHALAAENQDALSNTPLEDDQEMDHPFLNHVNDNEVHPAHKSPSPPPRPSGRPSRRIRLPLRYRDDLPPNPPIIQVPEDIVEHDDGPIESTHHASPESIPDPALFCTETNSFGIYRKYTLGRPTITPDEIFTLSSVSDSISIARDPADSRSKAFWWSSYSSSSLPTITNTTIENPANYFTPFLNPSTFLLMSWYYNGSSTKSYADVDKLIHNVIRHDDFKTSDFPATFSTAREAERMDKNESSKLSTKCDKSKDLPFIPEDGWVKASVSICVPCDGVVFKSEGDAPQFVVDGIWYRRPLEVIKLAFSEPAAEKFHITPFKEYWKPSNDEPEEQIYSESFTSDIFNSEYESLRRTHRAGPGAELEPFVAGIHFYSDATHLANFGTASLYPIYMYIGNQSQYIRAKPSEFTAHHIAYIPKVNN